MASPSALTALHRRRLRDIWRSAGWPCQDLVEVELLAAGLLERLRDGHGRETLRVTDAGIELLAATLQKNRAARDAHEALVGRVAREMQRAGRVVWRGLALRARVGEGEAAAWAMAMPDVFSIRHTTVEDYVEPVAHEIKVRRADLLADLRRPTKGEAYLQMSSQCWYVLRQGIGGADEIPAAFGVMLAGDDGTIEVARPAPRRAMKLPFMAWMALARAVPEPLDDDTVAQHRIVVMADSAQRMATQTHGVHAGQDVVTVPNLVTKIEAQVRGLGLMVGTEFSDAARVAAITKHCLEEGHLILMNAGTYGKVLRWMPPLVVNEREIDLALAAFAAALKATA